MTRRIKNGVARTSNGILKTTPAAVTNALVTWHKMSAGSGSTATDFADKYGDSVAQDATINGASWTSTAETGGTALSFDGVDDIATFPDPPINQIGSNNESNNFTLMGWFYARDLTNTSRPRMWSGGYDGSTTTFVIQFKDVLSGTSGKDLLCDTYDGSGHDTCVISAADFSLNTWHHFAFVYDDQTDIGDPSQFTGYLDATDKTADTTINNIGLVDNNEEWSFGDLLSSGSPSGQHFDGIVDDMRYYDFSKGGPTIQEIYNNTN